MIFITNGFYDNHQITIVIPVLCANTIIPISFEVIIDAKSKEYG